MRNLAGRATGTSLVVTIGLMVMLMGLAQGLWPPESTAVPRVLRRVERLPSGRHLRVDAPGHHDRRRRRVAAGAFWYLLNKTRTGTAMRAVVDDRNLAALNGASPARISLLAWAFGAVARGGRRDPHRARPQPRDPQPDADRRRLLRGGRRREAEEPAADVRRRDDPRPPHGLPRVPLRARRQDPGPPRLAADADAVRRPAPHARGALARRTSGRRAGPARPEPHASRCAAASIARRRRDRSSRSCSRTRTSSGSDRDSPSRS